MCLRCSETKLLADPFYIEKVKNKYIAWCLNVSFKKNQRTINKFYIQFNILSTYNNVQLIYVAYPEACPVSWIGTWRTLRGTAFGISTDNILSDDKFDETSADSNLYLTAQRYDRCFSMAMHSLLSLCDASIITELSSTVTASWLKPFASMIISTTSSLLTDGRRIVDRL